MEKLYLTISLFLVSPVYPYLVEGDLFEELKKLRQIIEQQNQAIGDLKKESEKQLEVNRKQDMKIEFLMRKSDEEAMSLKGIVDGQQQIKDIQETEVRIQISKIDGYSRITSSLLQIGKTKNESAKAKAKIKQALTYFAKSSGHAGINIRKGERLKRLILTSLEPIAFYTRMSSTTKNISGLQKLIFDDVMLNSGNAYRANSGVFIVPIRGIYVFTWSVRVYDDKFHSVELTKNGNEVGAVYSLAGNADDNTCGKTVVIQVEEGDEIYLRTKSDYNKGKIDSSPHGQTSFAGWKLN